MTRRVSAREARSRFAELTDRVRYTGEPVIVEKQGQPFVALISVNDLDALERWRAHERQEDFSRRAARAAREVGGPEPTEEEIVQAVKATREAAYRERYGQDVPIALTLLAGDVDIFVTNDRDFTDPDATARRFRDRVRVMLPAVFLREVLGWRAEDLEAIRNRTWQDIAVEEPSEKAVSGT